MAYQTGFFRISIALLQMALVSIPASAQQPPLHDPNHLISGWKYYSDNTIADPQMTLHDFFLQESVQSTFLPGGKVEKVRVWTKGLSATAVNKLVKPPKTVIDQAAAQYIVGYDPPFSAVRKLNSDQRMSLTVWEAVADEQLVSAELKALMEIDCENDLVRTLSIVVTHGGKTGIKDAPTPWLNVPPESSAANLSKILCK